MKKIILLVLSFIMTVSRYFKRFRASRRGSAGKKMDCLHGERKQSEGR